jgi:hypothetical protein
MMMTRPANGADVPRNCTLAKVATRRVGADAGERSDDFLICAIAEGDKLSIKVLFARH